MRPASPPQPLPSSPRPAARGAPARPYSAGQVCVALLAAAVVAVALDAEGLAAWAQRLEATALPPGVIAALGRFEGVTGAWGLAAPRRWLAAAGERAGALLGAAEDPLLASGWLGRGARPAPSTPDVAAPAPGPAAAPDGGVPGDASTPSVLLMGDSLIAGSLGATLRASLERGGAFRVVRAFEVGTGLARPDVYDWLDVIPPVLARDRPVLVVVALGGNDAQPLREGDEVVAFGGARWRERYEARVEAMMRALAAGGARVLWLGLPPMRDTGFDRRAASVTGIAAQVARRVEGVDYLPLDTLVSGGDGRYASFLPGPDGRLVRYRLDDGVHFAPGGARAISGRVLEWVREQRR